MSDSPSDKKLDEFFKKNAARAPSARPDEKSRVFTKILEIETQASRSATVPWWSRWMPLALGLSVLCVTIWIGRSYQHNGAASPAQVSQTSPTVQSSSLPAPVDPSASKSENAVNVADLEKEVFDYYSVGLNWSPENEAMANFEVGEQIFESL